MIFLAVAAISASSAVVRELGLQLLAFKSENVGVERKLLESEFSENQLYVEIQPITQDCQTNVPTFTQIDKIAEIFIDFLGEHELFQVRSADSYQLAQLFQALFGADLALQPQGHELVILFGREGLEYKSSHVVLGDGPVKIEQYQKVC